MAIPAHPPICNKRMKLFKKILVFQLQSNQTWSTLWTVRLETFNYSNVKQISWMIWTILHGYLSFINWIFICHNCLFFHKFLTEFICLVQKTFKLNSWKNWCVPFWMKLFWMVLGFKYDVFSIFIDFSGNN